LTTIVVVLAAVALGLVVAVRVGAITWQRLVKHLIDQITVDAHNGPVRTARFFTEQLAQLPPPVRRYFAFALSPGQPLVVTAQTTSRGEFRMQLKGGWHPFTATQHYSTSPRAFVWNASIDVAPLVTVRVTDRYLDGEGAIYGRAAAIIPVVDEHGTPELAQGELLRYLAEGVLMPTALLPSSGVSWTAVDDNTARASLSDHGTTVSAMFHFGPRGEIARVTAVRQRQVDGAAVMTPWVGRFNEYKSVQGMMIPMLGEVAWVLPGGDTSSYYRGRTLQITFELAA
jgi:hypothetical protein